MTSLFQTHFCKGISLFLAALFVAVNTPGQTASSPNRYHLIAGDELEIRFLYNPELNERAPIRPDGRISVQMMGEVGAEGLSVAELVSKLEGYFKSQITRPAISIQVRGFGNQKVFVGGEVARPGTLPLPGSKTVLEALIEAGGLKETAQNNSVLLIRRGVDGKPTTYTVLMHSPKTPLGAGSLDAVSTALEPFDVVLVTESGISKADRVVDQYVRRMIPATLTGGFTYLFGAGTAAVIH